MGTDYIPTGKPVGRPDKYKPEYCQQLVDHMATGMSFESFAANIGVHWDTLYEWCKVHPEFSEAKKEGKCLELKVWENLALCAASGMAPKSKTFMGKVNPQNAAVLIFSLKNKFPKLYRDKTEIEADINVKTSPYGELTEEEKANVLKAALDAKARKSLQESNE